jgi:nicotinamide-nucleotide amidase
VIAAERVGELARTQGRTVAVAESLTGGLLTSRLAVAREASVWLRGGIVAYGSDVKYRLLRVPPGPVVSARAASAMASSAAGLFVADSAVAVTGVAGPGEQDGLSPGTVWVGLFRDGAVETVLLQLHGNSPQVICDLTCDRSLELLVKLLSA